ncbi:MAG: class I SAM-dependent methyltransferase [Planctomycetota bacterium]
MDFDLEETNCPLCGCRERTFLFEKPDARYFLSPHSFRVVRCRDCSAGYLTPRPTIETVSFFYPEDFYEGRLRAAESDFNRRRYPLQAAYFQSLPAGARILDIGCATGSFARYLSESCGFESYGMDLMAPRRLDHDPDRLRFGRPGEMDFSPGTFDGISAFAVFEHLHEPMEYFRWAARLLKPGGRLVILVTNFNSLLSRFAREEDVPRHLVFFTRKALRHCSLQAGFLLDHIGPGDRIYGGSGYGALAQRFLLAAGMDWRRIKRDRHEIPLMLRGVAQALRALGLLIVPPPIERFLGVSGTMIATLIKASEEAAAPSRRLRIPLFRNLFGMEGG